MIYLKTDVKIKINLKYQKQHHILFYMYFNELINKFD